MHKKLAEGVFLTACPKGLRTTTTRLRSSRKGRRPFRTLAREPQDQEADAEELLRLLGSQISDWKSFNLPAPPSPTRRSSSADVDGDISLEVELQPDEQAVLLLEQEGVYSWNFGKLEEAVDTTNARGRRRAGSGVRRMQFTIGVGRRSTRGRRRGRR